MTVSVLTLQSGINHFPESFFGTQISYLYNIFTNIIEIVYLQNHEMYFLFNHTCFFISDSFERRQALQVATDLNYHLQFKYNIIIKLLL